MAARWVRARAQAHPSALRPDVVKKLVTLRTCASLSQHQPLGPLSRKDEQSFHVL
jgi:hypothetical protein